MLIFLTSFLVILAFYQLILSIDEGLRENKYAIGVLRAMGMKKYQVSRITVIEASSNIVSATILGYVLGHMITVVTMSVLVNTLEMKVTNEFNLKYMLILIVINIIIVMTGAKISMHFENKKRIT